MNLHQEVIMKGTLLVKNVKHLVTCDGDDRLLDGVDVFIRDGVIAVTCNKMLNVLYE